MRNLIILFSILLSNGCSKKMCRMYRYDLARVYMAARPADTIYFQIWKLPVTPFSKISKDIADSLNTLKSNGYTISTIVPLTYQFINCDDCTECKDTTIKCTYFEMP